MTFLGYLAIGFCTLTGCLGGYSAFDFVATKTGLKADVASIKAKREANDFYDDEDDEDEENDDILVQMASQNRSEAADPVQ